MNALPWLIALLCQFGILYLFVRFLRQSGKRGFWSLMTVIPLLAALIFGYYGYQAMQGDGLDVLPALGSVIFSVVLLFLAIVLPPELTRALRDYDSVQRESDECHLVLDHIPQSIVVKDNRSVYTRINPAFANLIGKSLDVLLGRSDADFFPHKLAQLFQENEKKALESGEATKDELDVVTVKGLRTFAYSFVPIVNKLGARQGILVSGHDITEKNQEIQRMNSMVQGYELIDEAIESFSRCTQRQQVLDTAAEYLDKLVHARHLVLGEIQTDGSLMTIILGKGLFESHTGEQLRPGNGLLGKAWQSGKELIIEDYPNWSGKGKTPEEESIHSAIGLPIRADGTMWGALGFYFESGEEMLSKEEIAQLSKLGQFISLFLLNLQKAQMYESALTKARKEIELLAQRQRLEHFLAALATRLVNESPTAIDGLLQKALQTVAEYLSFDRSYLCLFRKEDSEPEIVLEWSMDGFGYSYGGKRSTIGGGSSWLLDKIYHQESVYIDKTMGGDIGADSMDYLTNSNIEAMAAFPLVTRRLVAGYLGFESVGKPPILAAEQMQVVKLFADLIINALERKRAAEELDNRLQQTKEKMLRLELTSQRSKLIAELGELLQSCRTADESYPIVARYAQQLIPYSSGSLYLLRNIQDAAEKVASWGAHASETGENELVMSECWGIRRGKLHLVTDPAQGPMCGHLSSPPPERYLCVPLIAQGDTVGLIHIRDDDSGERDTQTMQDYSKLASALAEHIAPALSNLSLRDKLRSQAIRDPLTGLFNRRYMEETLEREIRRAARHKSTVGIIMCDIDQMKPINDRYGHDAGDALLRIIGALMVKMFRGEDVACRFGGDEFTVILPEASLSDVWQRAESLRDTIKKTSIDYEGKNLGPITVSIGVAAYPDLGTTAERLLQVSDAAVYLAKDEGGDRVMIGRRSEEADK